MTSPRDSRYSDDLPPIITADGGAVIRTSAGSSVAGRAFVTNRAPEPRIIAVTFLGVDAEWLPDATRSRVLMPGETVPMDFTLHPSVGTLAARYPFAITVQAIDPATTQATSSAAIADYSLVVDAPGRVEVQIVPNEITRRLRGKVEIRVTNVGQTPENVRIEVQSPDAAAFSLAAEEVQVAPGETATVPAKVAVEPQTFGRPTRYTYTVTARGRGAARRAEAAITTRAILGNNGPKFFALVLVVALWAGLAITFIPSLVNKINDSGNSAQDKVANAQDKALDKLRRTQTATPEPGQSGGNGGGSGSGGGSNGGSGGGSNGGSGGGSNGGSGGSGGSGAGTSSTGAQPVQFGGTIEGDSPSGVTVSMRPTSLVDEEAQGRNVRGVGVKLTSFDEIGKIPQAALTPAAATAPNSGSSSPRSTTTRDDGAWGFAKVTSPGYYLVTFAKNGYQTQRFVLDASSAAATEPLKVNLLPGKGVLSGRITGPNGPVGGASITLSDGTNTVSSSSSSTGDVGSWSVDGLSTPGSYLVTASKDGLSTESTIVTLGAGSTQRVSLDLKRNAATLTGTVYGPSATSKSERLGNVSVTATSESTERSSTTISTGNLVGSFRLPDLPAGDYVITTRAAGYLTQTRAVTIDEGEVTDSIRTDLKSATAVVTGTVKGVQFNDDGSVKTGANGKPVSDVIGGAGIMLTSETNKYKVTTEDTGGFRLDGIAPGSYVVSAQFAGLGTAYADIDVAAGETKDVPLNALQLPVADNRDSSSITGFVASATNPSGAITCPLDAQGQATDCDISLRLRNSDNVDIETNIEDAAPYTFPTTTKPSSTGPTPYSLYSQAGLPAGVYRLTVSVPGYLPATVTVRVPANTVATAPTATLFPTNGLIGRVNSTGVIADDGPIARSTDPAGAKQQPFTTCIVARPVSFDPRRPNTAPTDCTPPADTGACQQRAEAQEALAEVDKATQEYVLKGLCDGVYNVYAVTENPWYVTVTGPAQQTLFRGQTVSFSPTIARDGRVPLSIGILDPDTGDEKDAVKSDFRASPESFATCGPAEDRSYGGFGSMDDQGTVIIDGVNRGDSITCTITATFADGTAVNRSFTVASVANETDSASVRVVLTKPVGDLAGKLVTSYEGNTNKVLANTSISVEGTVANGNGTTGTGTIALRTDAKGCFAITSAASGTVSGLAGSCSSVTGNPADQSSGAVAYRTSLVSPFVTVIYGGDTGLQPMTTRMKFTAGGTTLVPVVADWRSTASIKLGTNLTNDPDLSAATITVTKADADGNTTAAGAGDVKFTSDASGNLTWTDSKIPGRTNAASPGTYQLTAKLTGFIDAKATMTCAYPGGKQNPSDSDFKPCVLDKTFELTALAEFHGRVYGVQGDTLSYTDGSNPTAGNYPRDLLDGATVSITKCTNDTATNRSDCTVGNPATTYSATTSGGSFRIKAPNASSNYSLPAGKYTLSVTSEPKFKPYTPDTLLTLGGGDNTAPDYDLFRKQITLTVQLTTNNANYTCPNRTCTVTLKRVGTGQTRTLTYPTPPDGTNYSGTFVFANLNPAVYDIQATGTSIVLSKVTETIDSTQTYNLPVTTLATGVNGSVQGPPLTQTGATAGLNGVYVQIGTKDGDTFSPAKNDAGQNVPGVTTAKNGSGLNGQYSFNDVAPGEYILRFNFPVAKTGGGVEGLDGYVPQESTTSVTVVANQLSTFPSATLARVTRAVTIVVTTSNTDDDIGGATGVRVRNKNDASWALGAGAVSTQTVGSGKQHSWTVNTVPSGDWKVEFTLPGGHLGDPAAGTGSPTLSCAAPSLDGSNQLQPRACTTDSGSLTVSGGRTDYTAPTAASAPYTLAEFPVSLAVGTSKLASDPNATVPDTAISLSDGATKVYQSTATSDSAATRLFWGKTGRTYTSTAGTGKKNWTANNPSFTSSSSSQTITRTERGATIKVTVTAGATISDVNISLTAPDGSGVTGTYSMTNTKTATFTDVPFYTGWKAKATGTKTTTAGTPPVATTTPVSKEETFDITDASTNNDREQSVAITLS